MYYYGYRYYSSEPGRWINRDPINELGHTAIKFVDQNIYDSLDEEQSGLELINKGLDFDPNLYQFLYNNSLSHIDPDGEFVVVVAFVAAKVVAIGVSYVVLKTTAYTISPESSKAVDDAMKKVVEINATEAASMAAGEVIGIAVGAGWRYFKICGKLKAGSKLIIEAGEFSASEIRAAEHMAGLGKKVRLRQPIGTRVGGGTSDLLVDGVPYDVYTPTTSNPSRIISAIAKKNSQAAGIVLDLSNSSVTPSQLGSILKRVQGAGAKNIKDIVVIGI